VLGFHMSALTLNSWLRNFFTPQQKRYQRSFDDNSSQSTRRANPWK